MSRWYLDTSAALKFLVEEPESSALAELIDHDQPDLLASYLLETELRRAATRIGLLSQSAVTTLLDGISLYDVPPSIFREAGLLPGGALRSLDALHLATAIRLGVDGVLTYDRRMREAADSVGLRTLSPGE